MAKNLSRFKRGRVYVNDQFAGIIEEKENLFIFTYNKNYILNPDARSVSLTLPLRSEPYVDKTMIPFFDGLIPEGWLLDIVIDNWKVDPRDRMQLLLVACKDCIGNISILAEEPQ